MMIYLRNFAVKQGNIYVATWVLISSSIIMTQLFSTAFDQHEIQLRTSWYWWSRCGSQNCRGKSRSGGPGFLRKAGNADGVSRAIASRFWAILRNTEKVSLRAIPAMNIDIKS